MHNDFDTTSARRRCLGYRRRILEISQQVSALHIAPAFSCLEIVDCIYWGLIRQDAQGNALDTFVMSKGHGCMSQYVVLEDRGVLSKADLDGYCRADGRLGAHPDYGLPGIEASTGSLGHGMALATGMAYADRIRGVDRCVYVVCSDGEFQEGSTWEAMMMAANLRVSNLVAFIDHNGFQSFGRTTETHPSFYPIAEKARAFGWKVAEVNGHDAGALYRAAIDRAPDRPLLVVANTVKGRGVSYMENVPLWHYRSPNKTEFQTALNELKEIAS